MRALDKYRDMSFLLGIIIITIFLVVIIKFFIIPQNDLKSPVKNPIDTDSILQRSIVDKVSQVSIPQQSTTIIDFKNESFPSNVEAKQQRSIIANDSNYEQDVFDEIQHRRVKNAPYLPPMDPFNDIPIYDKRRSNMRTYEQIQDDKVKNALYLPNIDPYKSVPRIIYPGLQ